MQQTPDDTHPTTVTREGRKLADPQEGLLRRVQRTPKSQFNPVPDQTTGCLRPPAAAFEPRFPNPDKPDRPVDEALSINVQSSLLSAGLSLTWGADPRKHYVAQLTAEDCLGLGLEAYHVPDIKHDNPHHELIWDLVGMFASDLDRYERTINALARASTIVPDAA